MKILDIPQKGACGRVVASRNGAGQFRRERVPPHQPGTKPQRGVWENMEKIAWLWNELEPEQWAAWDKLTEHVYSRPSLGQNGRLNACQLFKKLNCVLATCHRELLLDPPPLPQFGPNTVDGFAVRDAHGKLRFELQVCAKALAQARSPLEDLMVFSWAPCNAGTARNDLYAFLGLLRPPVGGVWNITGMYLAKLREWRKLKPKRYHVPLENSRVFVRVCKQVNGWQNELGLFRASALVRSGARGSPAERAARLRKLLGAYPRQSSNNRAIIEE